MRSDDPFEWAKRLAHKPLIRFENGEWWCFSLWSYGQGPTPKMAWRIWELKGGFRFLTPAPQLRVVK